MAEQDPTIEWSINMLAIRDEERAAIEKIVFSEEANLYRDEACRGVAELPYASNRYVRLLDAIRDVVRESPA